MITIIWVIAILFLVLWILTDDDNTILISGIVILICVFAGAYDKNISINDWWNNQNINQKDWFINHQNGSGNVMINN